MTALVSVEGQVLLREELTIRDGGVLNRGAFIAARCKEIQMVHRLSQRQS